MNTENQAKGLPVQLGERIYALDLLRGFALLGILIMNIQSFSMINAAYLNPSAYGDLTGINLMVWVASHVFADSKFMAIFSMLFGAGIVLFSQRADSKGARSTRLHYRRTAWLILFGILHAYLIWYGDILFCYGICALLAYVLRKRSAKTLFILGLLILLCGTTIYVFVGWSIPYWPTEMYESTVQQNWAPTAEVVTAEIQSYTGSWIEQNEHRFPGALFMQTAALFAFLFWRAGGLILMGMALFKWGILSAKKDPVFYWRMIFIGFGIGIPVVIFGVVSNFQNEWRYDYSFFFGNQFNYWGSLFVAAGYIGAIMLWSLGQGQKTLKKWFSNVGRTAFTNYILQSIVCTFIFYGHGLALFGNVERKVQILLVISIWVFQVVVSILWCRHFQYGPLEWLWRSLTYWNKQPFRLKK